MPCWKFRSPYLGKAHQPQEQHYPFLPVCAVFSCVPNNRWLPVFGIFIVCASVDVCGCTWGLYSCGLCKRVHAESRLWEKNVLPHSGLEPVSVLHQDFQSDSLAAELLPLFHRHFFHIKSVWPASCQSDQLHVGLTRTVEAVWVISSPSCYSVLCMKSTKDSCNVRC